MNPLRDLRAYADDLVAGADADDGARIARTALLDAQPVSWKRRLVSIGTAVAMFLGANVGLAAAANPATPGDALYGIDRAYEKVGHLLGIDNDGPAERFEEAAVLAERGDLVASIELAQEAAAALGNPGLQRAVEAIAEASNQAPGLQKFDEGVPPGIANALSKQATELYGIGRQISELAKTGAKPSGSEMGELTRAFREQAGKFKDGLRHGKPELPPTPAGKANAPGQNKDR